VPCGTYFADCKIIHRRHYVHAWLNAHLPHIESLLHLLELSDSPKYGDIKEFQFYANDLSDSFMFCFAQSYLVRISPLL